MRRFALVVSALVVVVGCKKETGPVRSFVEAPYPVKLSGWALFKGEPGALEPNAGVLPYDVATPLFSDFAEKYRTVWVPPGSPARYHATETFDFPVGTVLSKTFMYPRGPRTGAPEGSAGNGDRSRRLVETRLLVHAKEGWVSLPYVWDEDGKDATLGLVGTTVPVEWKDARGEVRTLAYEVPNANQCLGCHEHDKRMTPIGLKARHLNKPFAYEPGGENQLARMVRAGVLDRAPADSPHSAVWNQPASGTLEQRARAYLDANCGHCHSPHGPAASTALDLRATADTPRKLGVCKPPVAAGRGSGSTLLYDIVPGKPEESILVYRLKSTDPGVMMPEVGRTLVHEEGVELLSEWVRQMKGSCKD